LPRGQPSERSERGRQRRALRARPEMHNPPRRAGC
jgi:hypothetical protein